jgi:hypothetical protein
MTDASDGKRDFFISFNQADRAWATWVAWVLEEAGHSVFFQDWDFRGNFVEHMNRAHAQARRTLAVLSDHYFGSDFTLAEWSARLAQDPAAREDRLVPIKVGPLADQGILGPLVYADLTGCDEGKAQRRLLGRVKKALDADYRDKPQTRPGFPGGPPREVPSRPEFPPVEPRSGASRREEGPAMTGDRSVSIGRDAVGNIMVTGDRNRVDTKVSVTWSRSELPPAASVDIQAELRALKEALAKLASEDKALVESAVVEAEHLAKKLEPRKDKIGAALERAVGYAGSAEKLAQSGDKLWPTLKVIGGWLGEHGTNVLRLAGIALV